MYNDNVGSDKNSKLNQLIKKKKNTIENPKFNF